MKKSMHFLRTIVASMFGNLFGIYIGEKICLSLTHCTLQIIRTCKRSRSSSSRATTTPCLLTLVWRGRGCWGCCRGWTWCRGWCLFWCIGDLWLSRGEVGCELVYYRLFSMRYFFFQCDNKFLLTAVLKNNLSRKEIEKKHLCNVLFKIKFKLKFYQLYCTNE